MAKRRTRGDGSLHLRKDGRWEGRYVVGYDDKGLPVTKNVLAKTKSECAAKLAQLRDTLKEPAPDQPKPGILLADWLNLWYQGYKKPNLRPNTQMSYERRIYQHIIPALGGTQLDKLTTADIQEFYVSLKKSGRLIRSRPLRRGTFRSDCPRHSHHPPRRAGQGRGRKSDFPKSFRWMSTPLCQAQGNEGPNAGGDPAVTDPGQRGWLLRAAPTGVVHRSAPW